MNEIVRSVFANLLPDLYERCKERVVGYGYPEYFDKTRSIFIHVPKTAGTSVVMALYGKALGHHTWRDWYQLSPRKFNQYFKFAIIRDPVERFISAFTYLKKGGMNAEDREFSEKVLAPFEDPGDLSIALTDGALRKIILNWPHFRPQCDFVADKNGLSVMDLLVEFSELTVGFEWVCRKLGIDAVLPHLNQTGTCYQIFQSTENASNILREVYREDFDLIKQADHITLLNQKKSDDHLNPTNNVPAQ